MDTYDLLDAKLRQYTDPGVQDFLHKEVPLGEISTDALRPAMLDVGRIVEWGDDSGIVVGVINAGIGNLNEAILAASCVDGSLFISSRAKEGVINQGTAEKAVDKLLIAMGLGEKDNCSQPASKAGSKGTTLVVAIAVAIALIALTCVAVARAVSPAVAATVAYNEAAGAFNDLALEYDEKVTSVSIENVEGMPDSIGAISLANELWPAVAMSLLGGNSCEKINADAQTVRTATEALQYDVAILDAINHPDEAHVESALWNVEGVSAVASVTEDNDPNAMLGKEGGYLSCTYFTLSMLGEGDDPVGAGVDGGGAVEVYPTLADAEARCEYLSGFDETVFYSGSYSLIGTMVVRMSWVLSNEDQLRYTSAVFEALTDITEE